MRNDCDSLPLLTVCPPGSFLLVRLEVEEEEVKVVEERGAAAAAQGHHASDTLPWFGSSQPAGGKLCPPPIGIVEHIHVYNRAAESSFKFAILFLPTSSNPFTQIALLPYGARYFRCSIETSRVLNVCFSTHSSSGSSQSQSKRLPPTVEQCGLQRRGMEGSCAL